MGFNQENKPCCDGVIGCSGVVSYIDKEGFIYCDSHGKQRQSYTNCRKLKAHEIKRIENKLTIKRY